MSARSVDVLLARAAVRAAMTRTRTSAVGQPEDVRAALEAAARHLEAVADELTQALYAARRAVFAERASS